MLDLNFVPSWARETPGQNPYAHFEGGARREERGGRGAYRPGAPSRRPPDRSGRPPPRGGGPRRDRHERAGGERRSFRREDERRPQMEPRVPVSVSFIPERNRLGLVVHDLRSSGRSYPLAKVAHGFLSNPAHYMVKIEAMSPREGGEPLILFQCKACGVLSTDEPAALAHATSAHLETQFTREDREVEPPSGNFICIARCRLSGELLGPPNYHGYNERLLDLHRMRFAHMPLDEYRKQIETLRDPELIERWKQGLRRVTVYRARENESVELSRRAAEKIFMEQFAASFVSRVKRAVISPETAAKLEDPALRNAVRDAWTRESHRPFTLMLALRPAFHHMRLHLFKTRGGATFVSAIPPHPLESAHAVRPIAEVLDFVREHPGCTRQRLVETLRPGSSADSQAVSEVISPLRWLIEKGHVIEFFDGTLSVPSAGVSKRQG